MLPSRFGVLLLFVRELLARTDPPAPAAVVAALRRNFPTETGQLQTMLRRVPEPVAVQFAVSAFQVAPAVVPWLSQVFALLVAEPELAPPAADGAIEKTA